MSSKPRNPPPPGVYYLDDLRVGDRWRTGALTLTESQITGFAGLSGDFFDLHMDDQFARELGFSGRIAHGILGLALIDGLKNRAEVRLPGVASLGWTWDFRAPLVAGDRIHGEIEVRALRPTRRPERGVVTLAMRLMKNGDAVAQEGENRMLMRRRDP